MSSKTRQGVRGDKWVAGNKFRFATPDRNMNLRQKGKDSISSPWMHKQHAERKSKNLTPRNAPLKRNVKLKTRQNPRDLTDAHLRSVLKSGTKEQKAAILSEKKIPYVPLPYIDLRIANKGGSRTRSKQVKFNISTYDDDEIEFNIKSPECYEDEIRKAKRYSKKLNRKILGSYEEKLMETNKGYYKPLEASIKDSNQEFDESGFDSNVTKDSLDSDFSKEEKIQEPGFANEFKMGDVEAEVFPDERIKLQNSWCTIA